MDLSKAKTIRICAKCSDLFNGTLLDKDGRQIGEDYDGYVPEFFPEDHYGDYVQLDIELATGKITNWKKPTQEDLAKVFDKEGNDD